MLDNFRNQTIHSIIQGFRDSGWQDTTVSIPVGKKASIISGRERECLPWQKQYQHIKWMGKSEITILRNQEGEENYGYL